MSKMNFPSTNYRDEMRIKFDAFVTTRKKPKKCWTAKGDTKSTFLSKANFSLQKKHISKNFENLLFNQILWITVFVGV